jgi:Zn-dependent alcohol dehydrogenase
MATEYPAVVCYPPNPGPDWRVETVKIPRSPKEHELKVRMLATGICHSDVFISCIPDGVMGTRYPRVLGHEGAGIVEEVGPGVTVAKVGDPVLLSYNYCKSCDLCKIQKEPYCLKWRILNVIGEKGIFETSKAEDAIAKFMGQSSFASMSIVSEGSVVNVKGMVKNNEELKLMAPLGCGLMTGSGAVVNSAKAQPHDIVLVTGIGAVGLGAVMAAKISGCKEIIAVDRVVSRLEVAKELGATIVLDTSKPDTNFVEEMKKLINGQRISYVVETTGVIPVIQACAQAMGKHGKLIQIGIPALGSELTIRLSEFFGFNKTFECHGLGDTTGQAHIPKMLQWYREGKFPIEKIVKYFPAKDALQALHEMESGTAIKPVIVWNDGCLPRREGTKL